MIPTLVIYATANRRPDDSVEPNDDSEKEACDGAYLYLGAGLLGKG